MAGRNGRNQYSKMNSLPEKNWSKEEAWDWDRATRRGKEYRVIEGFWEIGREEP